MQNNHDDRSMIAKAWGWGYGAMSISLEMVVPAIFGMWIDRWLGTLPLFLLLGAALGMIVGLTHLVQFAQRINKEGNSSQRDNRGSKNGEGPE